jgi:hypothetical protein
VNGALAWFVDVSTSGVALEADAVFVTTVWSASPALTWATMVVERVSPAAVGPIHVHVTVPGAPGAGAVHDPPSLAVAETNVMPDGSGSEIERSVATAGPSFVAVTV